mmetsp:Transcript_93106/g.267872  ORF Transcript_93106/g.267872 Transcript_93106/m.267872 type:complete len:353 (-) Transcript_93106:9-1067(-)
MDHARAGVVPRLNDALRLRKKRVYAIKAKTKDLGTVKVVCGHDGIMRVLDHAGSTLIPVPSLEEFYEDSGELFRIRSFGPVATYCHQRLRLMQTRFELYSMLCSEREQEQAAGVGHRDFYNVRKVDTHIHHSAAMNAKHLLRFMKKKVRHFSSDVVEPSQPGQDGTLGAVFRRLGIGWENLSLDRLQVWADQSCKHRFDRFNNKYSPMGQNELRTIFLKTDNAIGGRYLAELTRELIDDLEESKYQHAEWRLSIYGRKKDEWENLSRWVLGRGKGLGDGRALLSPNIRWMIQIPRLYSLYKTSGQIKSFREMLENIFAPIFDATVDPAAHPNISDFLEGISGFDTVDDESAP